VLVRNLGRNVRHPKQTIDSSKKRFIQAIDLTAPVPASAISVGMLLLARKQMFTHKEDCATQGLLSSSCDADPREYGEDLSP